MDIISLASSFPRHRDDPSGRFIADLNVGLVKRGHRLLQLAPEAEGAARREGLFPGYLVERFPFAVADWQRGIVYGDGIGANLKRNPALVSALSALHFGFQRALSEALIRHPQAAILSHWAIPAGWVAARANLRERRSHVSVLHGGGVQLLKVLPFGSRFLRTWAQGTDRCLCVSADLAEKTRAQLGPKTLPIRVQPMGIDLDRFRPRGRREETRRELGLGPETFFVLGVGRLVKLKGFDLLIRAAQDLGDVSVALAGEGPERVDLLSDAEASSLDLHLLGRLGPEKLRDIYEAADVLVVPSRLGPKGRSEGSPVVVPEAYAAGLPVIASRTGGLSEAVQDQRTGHLFPAEDVSSLREILLVLKDDLEMRQSMAKAAFQEARHWGYDAVAAAVEEELIAAIEQRS
ncbi:MAG: glycosyltransferase family 4 protein [Planctomycetota bacterium]